MAKGLPEKEEREARESRLQLAIEHDDVDLLHNLIVEEPELLDRVSKNPFPNTPLHIAAAKGKFKVATEMVILRPSFARTLNPQGYSPMHLALQCKQYPIVRALMTLHPKLIRVRGQCGITPLHYIAGEKGDKELELLAEFLCTCKSSIEDLTSQCETAVHIAVKNQNLEAVNVLLGWLEQVHLKKILNWKDKDGNTVLHVAVSGEPQHEMIKLLARQMDVNAKNFDKKTALEIYQVHPRKKQDVVDELQQKGHRERFGERLFEVFFIPNLDLSLSKLFTVRLTFLEKSAAYFYIEDKSTREVILVVSPLMATATYQAALSPPGGYWQDSSSNPLTNSTEIAHEKPHQAGKMILSGSHLYLFTLLNSMTFLISMCIILAASVPLFPGTSLVCWSMFVLAATYFSSLTTGFQNYNDVGKNLIVGVFMVAMGLVFGLSFWIWLRRARVQRKINASMRRIGNF
ncbi:ankyrin repeat-containing protein BDA1-like [Eucalyptus grandis]|uniref:ankyrin repeat-containing protein BDA1-like n=1 Tax=Eucalyptus grandis TaxID=71139 RepID=UPI00192EDE38|nr:ankyrin repeat-containing protein BDA1-like [Eucalyptus grandis]